MDRSDLAVVIPCHNEAATIGEVVRQAARHADVIVVDDRSTDGSGQVARAGGARVIDSASRGYDGALDTGLRQAWTDGYRFVVTMDADGEHDPAILAQFRAAFEQGADLVCGFRPRPQRAAEYAVGLIGVLRFRIRDLLCGMKGYSRRVLERYYESGLPLSVNMAPAMLWRRAGGSVAEVAVTGTPRLDRPRFGRALKANWAIWRAFRTALAQTRRARPAPKHLGVGP
ncbi:MAG: glycosyltransferase family 2 protein [Caulobacteraceae bacterium]|nr:glycosyltransferase family 2 protein [Caulobacteraceae bacterium]